MMAVSSAVLARVMETPRICDGRWAYPALGRRTPGPYTAPLSGESAGSRRD
jgi:hypothetical protein